MAITASNKTYIRPSLNEDNIIDLEDCRHPLMEIIIEQFQCNSFYSGGKNSKVKIITGPNGSGKSVYLKQICLIVYLAHVGSFVPCARANINLLNTIHTKFLATESASVRLSSFMIELKQMANVLRDNSRNALILMDEFGKGTVEAEGVCLLEGVLKHFLSLKVDCPHILISTHFHNIQKHLPKSQLINYLKMIHTNENGVLLFLYKIAQGISNSFSIDAALAIGLDKDIAVRASQIFNSLTLEEPFKPSEEVRKRNNFNPHNLEEISIPEPNEMDQI